MTMGEKLRDLRIQKGLVQKAVATDLSISISTLSNYEHDRHQPDILTLRKLAVYYHSSTDYLLDLCSYSYDSGSITNFERYGITIGVLLEALSNATEDEARILRYMIESMIRNATDQTSAPLAGSKRKNRNT